MTNLPSKDQTASLNATTVTREQFRGDIGKFLEYTAQALGGVTGTYTNASVSPTAVTLQGAPVLASGAKPAMNDSSLRLPCTSWVKDWVPAGTSNGDRITWNATNGKYQSVSALNIVDSYAPIVITNSNFHVENTNLSGFDIKAWATGTVPMPDGATAFSVVHRSRVGIRARVTDSIGGTYATKWAEVVGHKLNITGGGTLDSSGQVEVDGLAVAPVANRQSGCYVVRFDTGTISAGTGRSLSYSVDFRNDTSSGGTDSELRIAGFSMIIFPYKA